MTAGEKLDAFSGTLRFPTVSTQEGPSDPSSFLRLHSFLRQAYPRVHGHLLSETVNEGSLLYTWTGTDPDAAPILLTAHLDVVPAGDDEAWPHPPFAGESIDGRIWGRGAVDYKVGVAGMLQACEDALTAGFVPVRGLCLAFGHDEEVGGLQGAAMITGLLEGRGIRFSSVLDEGGYVYSYPWLTGDLAVVGLAEKGYLTLRLTAYGDQGHASRPPLSTPAGRLGRCLALLEEHQMPARICGPVQALLAGSSRMFGEGILPTAGTTEELSELLQDWPDGNALVRTTTAPTIISGGARENILPAEVRAIVNFRPVPGDRTADVLDHVSRIVSPLGVEVIIEDPRHVFEASMESSIETADGQALLAAIDAVLPGIPVVPGIFPAATDSRHYGRLADQVYRFVPIPLGQEGLGAMHGEGESLACEDYLRAVDFYRTFIEAVCRNPCGEAEQG